MALFAIRRRRDHDHDLVPAGGSAESLLDKAWEGFLGNRPYLGQEWLRVLKPQDRFWGGPLAAVDVAETEKEIVVKAELPGLDKKDLEVNLEDGTLTISGEKKEEQEKKGKYYRLERKYGSFSRRIDLPAEVKGDKVEARYAKGLLTVTLPKAEEEGGKRKKIPVQ